MKKAWWIVGIFLVFMIMAGSVLGMWEKRNPDEAGKGLAQTLAKVQSIDQPQDSYELIVVGTDPEGIAAAISAARIGLKTLLVEPREERDILGGLFTLGWLNTIDMNYSPGHAALGKKVLNRGIFSEFFGMIEGDSFDVTSAANAFNELVKREKNIDLLLHAKSVEPILEPGKGETATGETETITGLRITMADGASRNITAKAVIDATQDGDIAAASGVPFTYGREDLGDKNSKMAVTLVFRLKNVTPDVWKEVRKRLTDDGDPNTGANEVSAWGYVEMYQYEEVNKGRVKMRGLNIGRQNDETMLINALQIFGIDGSDPNSRAEALEIGRNEIPHVVEYMKKIYPEFAGIELDAMAPELYVRETRHIQGEYRVTMLDVLENRDHWDRIAFGSYPVDIQRTSATDSGAVVSVPEQYAIPFRSLVPLKVDGLLVVGKAASYDTLPHGSARVVPIGMAEGESAGVAAKLAIESGMTFRQLSVSEEQIAKLQDMLNKQGMDIKPFQIKAQPYMEHKAYPGLKTAVLLALAYGGYSNDFDLDGASNPQRMVNIVGGARKIKPTAFAGDASAALRGVGDPRTEALTLEQASYTIAMAIGWKTTLAEAPALLLEKGVLKQATVDMISDKLKLANGDTYMMIKDLQEGL